MKLIIIRHGQTNYNLKDLCNGRPNSKVRLTPLGVRQARAAAKLLAKENFERIYISKLFRSRQTAEILNRFHNVPLISDERLNDRQMGVFENQPASLFYIWRDKQKDCWRCRPPQGETYEEMKKRVAAFLKDLSKQKYKKVLIVTHLPIIKVMRGYFKKLDNKAMDAPMEKNIPNCRIMKFTLPNT